MKRRAWVAGAAVALLGAVVAARGATSAREDAAQRVIVLANADDAGSLRIAAHYAAARGVPAANVVALKLPTSEVITWREFVATLWQPLMEQLVREKWIDAIAMAATDTVGRTKHAPNGHRMTALVVCRGVPLKIAHDAALAADALPFTSVPELRTNAGAVDAELSLLPTPNYNINAFAPNPLFQNDRPGDAERQVVRVARLDGPTVEDALGLVDRAIAAERTGLLGRAYVDLSGRDKIGDDWLEAAAKQLGEIGFDTTVDREPATIPVTARFDAPVLYFGWYAGDIDGPFTLPGFRFPPGAIALHIHSYSAGSLRTLNSGWTAPFVARGVTATVGNVHEPYLQYTHRPNLLLRALARGATLAEAAYYSCAVLSWQAVLVGDPLYRPFAVSVEEQLRRLPKLPLEFAGYLVERRMRELERGKLGDEAHELGVKALRDQPSLALAVALAKRLRESGDRENAANALGFAPRLTMFRADEWVLAAEAARLLMECGRAGRAVDLWRTLLAIGELPRALRGVWLRDAQVAARAAREQGQADTWAGELAAWSAAEKK